jgi:hypothetical protein
MGRGEARGLCRHHAGPAWRAAARWVAWLAGAALLLSWGAPWARAAPELGHGAASGTSALGFDAGSAAGLGDGGSWTAPVVEARALRVPHLTYWPATIFGPAARIKLGDAGDDARATLIRRALGEPTVQVQPASLSLGLRRVDLVAAYAFSAPATRVGPLRAGSSGDDWVNELTTGGTVYLDHARAWRLSALASYGVPTAAGPRAGADGARPATLRIRGGARIRLSRLVDVGAAGYTARLVGDDRSVEPPPPASRARQRTFGGGPEVNLAIPALDARVGVRYERNYVAQSQATADAFVLSLTFVGWGGG